MFDESEPLFKITIGGVQRLAIEKIGRSLTDEELQKVRDGLEADLMWWKAIVTIAIYNAQDASVDEGMGFWLSEDHLSGITMHKEGRLPTDKEIQSCKEFASRLYSSESLNETRSLSRWYDYWKLHIYGGDFLTWVGKNLDKSGDREAKEP